MVNYRDVASKATSLDWKGYFEFETSEKQCWSYLRNIKAAINYLFANVSHITYPYFS
jgi:hypothetical protein